MMNKIKRNRAPSALRLISLSWMMVTASAGLAAAGPMEDATAAYKRGDNVTAVKLLRPLAEAGKGNAQFYLGGMYDYGLGVIMNKDEAVKWYTKAAVQGVAQAQVNLGFKYQTGQGVRKDLNAALKWYELAANQGTSAAQFNLGTIFYDGPGGLRAYGEAAKWFLLAAQQGNPVAQFNLGTMFSEGKGVDRDDVQAYKWWDIASTKLPASEVDMRASAVSGRDKLGSKMKPDQLAQARKLAREWKPAGR